MTLENSLDGRGLHGSLCKDDRNSSGWWEMDDYLINDKNGVWQAKVRSASRQQENVVSAPICR